MYPMLMPHVKTFINYIINTQSLTMNHTLEYPFKHFRAHLVMILSLS